LDFIEEKHTMALTKIEIVESVQNQTGFSKNRSSEIVETLLEIIKSTLAFGDDVMISGFGKFSIKQKKERRGRNPATGDDMMLAPRKIVTFKCSGKLRDRINGN
jgi:integration host factor subunit alpha